MPDGSKVVLAYNDTQRVPGQRASYTATPNGAAQPSLVERFTYRGGELAQAGFSGTGVTTPYTDTYLYRQDGAPYELIRQTKSTGACGSATCRYWYLLDGRGNVVGLADKTGNVVDRYHYDLWGAPSIDLEAVKQPLLYAGYWYDRELHAPNATTGWYWLSVRPYNPALKRFTQPDPSMQDGIRSYTYVGDDPVDMVDPQGTDEHEVDEGAPIGEETPFWWKAPELPNYASSADITELENDTNRFDEGANKIDYNNTIRALHGPPGTVRLEVSGGGVAGGDIKFYGENDKLLLRREIKCLASDGNSNTLQKRISVSSKQIGKDGEVWIQIKGPEQINPGEFGLRQERIRGAVRSFQHEGDRKLASYSKVHLAIFDNFGRLYFYNYPLGQLTP